MADDTVTQVEAPKPAEPTKYDMGNEICNLWYELHYLRYFLSKIIENVNMKDGKALTEFFDDKIIDESRAFSMKCIMERYPHINFLAQPVVVKDKPEAPIEKATEPTV